MPDLNTNKLSYLSILLLVTFLVFFVNLDAIYVNIMEARNFITAREMLNHNNWLLTTLNDLPRYQKPPLPTWLTAISGSILGMDSLVALRLPAALSTLLLIYFFFRFIPKLKLGKKQAFISSLVLATSFYIVFSGRNGQWDIFTHAFMMVCIYYLWNFFCKNSELYQNAVLAGVFLGFSFMSKGPVSLYALFLPFLISFGIVYKFRTFRSKWKPFLVFLVVSLGIGLWWFIYVRLADPLAFQKIAEKEATNWTSYNIRPFWYYWSFFTQSGIWTIPSFVALLYPYLKDRVSNKKAYTFSFLWTILAVVLLSVIPEKKSRYLLPVLIPMAMNTGFYIEYLFRRFSSLPKKEKWVVYFNHGLIALIGIVFPIGGYFFLDLEGFWFWFVLTSLVLFSIGVAKLYFLRKQDYPKVFYLTISFIAAIIVCGFPLVGSLIDNPKFNNIAKLRELEQKENIQVYEYESFGPELIWEYGKPIPLLKEGDSVRIPAEGRFGLLTVPNDSTALNDFSDDFRIKRTARYDLNYVNPEKSGYKERLIRNFYILERKD
ncbi:ArnT family glycosyltransferase [Salegentibacter chungangensis]|uniref:ArnT family glycosyltransferase n=1 Tax=Salegentibacter chungangensis TaxID=1335724 RepID=A0ABW3NN81_9FLAO